MNAVAKASGARLRDMSVVVLDRDRHEDLIRELREVGVRVNLITDGDVAPAIAAARPAPASTCSTASAARPKA